MDLAAIIASIGPVVGPLFTQAFLAVMALLVTGATAFGIKLLQAKLSAQQLSTLSEIADIAVRAAEQMPGIEDKKQSALNAASAMLAKAGITVSGDVLEASIEAAVLNAFNFDYHTGSVKAKVDETVTTQAAPADAA